MSFKIVQTIEPGRKLPLLTIVPSAWEKEGTLFWPPFRKKGGILQIIRNGNSKPEKDWLPQPCTKKRQIFLSYEAADLELSAMTQKSDSEICEDEDNVQQIAKKRMTVKKRAEIGRVEQADFNNLAEECKKATQSLFGDHDDVDYNNENEATVMASNKNYENAQYTIITENKSQSIYMPNKDLERQKQVENSQMMMMMAMNQQRPIASSSSSQQMKVLPSQIYLSDEKGNSMYDSNSPAPQIGMEENEEFTFEVEKSNDQIDICINNQKTIMQNQTSLLENQIRIIQQLASQETMLQLLCQHMSNTATIAAPTTQASDKPCTSNDALPDPLPIDSLNKLNQLEMDLKDVTYMKQLVISKSQICGTNGKMNGLNCCYHLVDCFFDRKFLMQFSWSGGSRRDEGKNAFKMYKNVMKTFHKIISKADSQFAETECENFFKSVIKNARRRAELVTDSISKRRASSGKKIPKNLTYKKVEETQGDQIDINEDTERTEDNEVEGINETVEEINEAEVLNGNYDVEESSD